MAAVVAYLDRRPVVEIHTDGACSPILDRVTGRLVARAVRREPNEG